MLLTLAIGGIVGWLASLLMKTGGRIGLLASVVGAGGSLLGGVIASALGLGGGEVFFASGGAATLIAVFLALGVFDRGVPADRRRDLE